MANINNESDPLLKRPPAGLPLVAWAELGLPSAQAKIEKITRTPTAGLSLGAWAEMGLQSAQAKIEKLVDGN